MSKLDDVLKLAEKQNYTILLDKDGNRKFCVVPVDKEHIPDMTQRLEDQLKAEGKLGYYVGMIMPVSWEPCMDFLPIYGRTDKYETKWLCRYIEDAVADELKDRGSELYKRILAYEPNVAVIKSKTESIGKLHINEDASDDIDYELSKFGNLDNVEDLFDIADRYNTSSPVSGNWDTEIEHEQQAIADAFNISLEAAKKVMIKILGFDERDFNKPNPTTPVTNNSSNLDDILSYDNISSKQWKQLELLASKYDLGDVTVRPTPETLELVQKEIASILNIPLKLTKEFMMKYLGFHENDFNYNIPKSYTKNNDNDYIKIGKAIANYYEEISFNSNGIIIYTDNKKALYTEITNALKSIENIK